MCVEAVNDMVYTSFDAMPLVLGVNDISDTLSIGRNKAYELIATGQLRAVKIGKQFRIPRDSFIEFLKRTNLEEK